MIYLEYHLPSRFWLLLLVLVSSMLQAGDAVAAGNSSIGQRLQQRVQQDPSNANSWRLLGRWQLKNNQLPAAEASFRRAVTLNPDLVAAHFDLANLLVELGDTKQSIKHFTTVIQLAPDCDYATQAESQLVAFDQQALAVQPAGYEILRFDGSEHLDAAPNSVQEVVTPKLWHFRLEVGSIFNSNPALAPISRGLAPAGPETFQGVATPELELRLFDGSAYSFGTMLRGSFTHNEGNVRQLNLQSYQPGVFLEKVLLRQNSVLVSRMEYSFSHDEFDTKTLGNRHSLFASLARVTPSGSMTFGYMSSDYTNFAQDGISPEVTSQDGWTWATGRSHRFAIKRRWLNSFRLGVDGRYADLAGADFRFAGASVFIDAEIPITDRIVFKPEGGWGYRNYFDFTGSPSRNENIWRGGARLERKLNDVLPVATVSNYENFATGNAAFAADRYTAGVVAIIQY